MYIMKKLLVLAFMIAMMAGSLSARDRVSRDVAELPATAQKLLKTYYPKMAVNHIKIDSNLFGGADYDVVLNDGTELDFDKDGELKEIDCGMREVPSGLLLKTICDYVSKNFSGRKIVSMDIDSRKYEIELSDGIELEFDRSGQFLRIDD